MANFIYGLAIGGTTVKMGLIEEEGTMIDKWEIVTLKEDGGEQNLPDIAASIKEKNEEKNIATEDACRIEHVISQETFEAIKKYFHNNKD